MGIRMEEICPNCFAASMRNGVCAQCGYNMESQRELTAVLKPHTILRDRYIVGRVLGRGGFGITYKAYDLEWQSVCAFKEYVPRFIELSRQNHGEIVLTDTAKIKQYEHSRKRFREEAEILYRIKKYPYIVRIRDSFQENNTDYYVMEFVDGINLKQAVRENHYLFSEKEATDILLKIGSTLQAIYEKEGMIHRDISPENILIDKNGDYRLIDFGSAKEVEPEGQRGFSVVYKPGFAPLEQYSESMPQGSYTDVYALAGTYYYLTTGQMAPSALERMGGHNHYTPLYLANRSISKNVSDAIDRALVVDYKKRTQTIRQLLYELTQQPAGSAGKSAGYINRPGGYTGGEKQKSKHPGAGYLEIIEGKNAGKSWMIPDDGKCRVAGRDSNRCHIVLPYGAVSSTHFEIRFDAGKGIFRGKDYSRNGMVVNERFVSNAEFVAEIGSVLRFPGTDCKILLGVKDGQQK